MVAFVISILIGCFIPYLLKFSATNANLNDGVTVLIIMVCLASLGFFIAGVTKVWDSYVSQIKDIERIKRAEDDKEVYQARQTELTEVFKQHLAIEYPKYEAEIFSKLIPENVTAVATLFPEIKMSDVIVKYCTQIADLTDSVYKQDLRINDYKSDIRIRARDFTNFWFLMPTE